MRTLTQNPLIRFLFGMWWLPAFLLVILPFIRPGAASFQWLVTGGAVSLGLAVGVVGLPALQARAAGGRERSRHAAAGHRFLCPACLCLGDHRFACASCGKEIDALIVHTDGRFVDRCPHCSAKVAAGKVSGEGLIRAYCGPCGASYPRSIYHERAVRVVGALTQRDFDTLCDGAGEASADTHGVHWIRRDDGRELTYLLSLADLSGGKALPAAHAARNVQTVWLGEVDPLILGQAVDSFVTRAELDDSRLAAITGCVGEPQLDPSATRLLSARFGMVNYGVPARDFFPQSMPAEQEPQPVPAGVARAERSGAA